MADSYNSSNVKCPFYVKDKPNYIVCDGVSKGTRINLWFSSNKEKNEYMQKHCNHISQKCHIAKMHEDINKKRLESR